MISIHKYIYILGTVYLDIHMWYTHLHTEYKILFTQPDHIPTQRQHMNTKRTQTQSLQHSQGYLQWTAA